MSARDVTQKLDALLRQRFRGDDYQNSAMRRRSHAKFRAKLIRLLGWKSEDPKDRYAATTGELRVYAREKFGRKGYSPEEVRAAERRRTSYAIGG